MLRASYSLNINSKSDQEIQELAEPLWADLVKHSNEGKYGEFTKDFARDFARAMSQIETGHQFANSELARNLAEDAEYMGTIRRGDHVTVVFRQKCTSRPGEWLGRLVLGMEDDQVRIFSATIF